MHSNCMRRGEDVYANTDVCTATAGEMKTCMLIPMYVQNCRRRGEDVGANTDVCTGTV